MNDIAKQMDHAEVRDLYIGVTQQREFSIGSENLGSATSLTFYEVIGYDTKPFYFCMFTKNLKSVLPHLRLWCTFIPVTSIIISPSSMSVASSFLSCVEVFTCKNLRSIQSSTDKNKKLCARLD